MNQLLHSTLKARGLKVTGVSLVMIGILLSLFLNLIFSPYVTVVPSRPPNQVQNPRSASLSQTAVFPASGALLFPNNTYNFTAGLRDDTMYNRTYTGGYLAINKSGNPYSNTSLTPIGTYNASFSFTNDVNGQQPVGISCFAGGGNSISIINAYLGHSKVLQQNESDNSSSLQSTQTFPQPAPTHGTISFWFACNTTSGSNTFYPLILGTGTDEVKVGANYNAGGQLTLQTPTLFLSFGTFAANTWVYVLIDYDTATGLANASLNGVRGLTNAAFIATGSAPTQWHSQTYIGQGVETFYLDAIDYSWDPAYYVYRNTVDISPLGIYNATDSFTTNPATYNTLPEGTYNATFSFKNEPYTSGGAYAPSGWVTAPFVGITYGIQDFNGHSKIFYMTDGSSTGYYSANQTFASTAPNKGTIGFWWAGSALDTQGGTNLLVAYDGSNNTVFNAGVSESSVGNGSLDVYYTGAWHPIVNYTTNTWYYIKIDYDVGSHICNFSVNGTTYLTNVPCSNLTAAAPTRISTQATNSTIGFTQYLDAVDYSWDAPYTGGYTPTRYNVDMASNPFYKFQVSCTSFPINPPAGSFYYMKPSSGNIAYLIPSVPTASTGHDSLLFGQAVDNQNNGMVMGLGPASGTVSLEIWFYIQSSGDSISILRFNDAFGNEEGGLTANGSSLYQLSSASGPVMTYSPQTWVHARIVVNTISHTFDIYINGQLKASSLGWETATPTTVNEVWCGWHGSGNSAYFDGWDSSVDPTYSPERSSYVYIAQNASFMPGNYSFSYVLNDSVTTYAGPWSNFTVINPLPTITTTTPTYIYIAGTTGNNLSWNITDNTTSSPTYAIYRNNTLQNSSTWTSGVPINDNIDGWSIGYYNVTIVANNGFNATSQNQVNVTVDDVPQINTPTSVIIVLNGTTGLQIPWTVMDTIYNATNSTYRVFRNSVLNATGPWSSGVPISIPIDSPVPVGIYNWTIMVSDGFGGNASNEVDVNSTNNPPPFITTSALSYLFVAGAGGNVIQWNITDPATGINPTYTFYINSTINGSITTWTSSWLANLSTDSWGPGYYNVTMVANNGQGAISQWQVNVTVDDVPQLSQPANVTFPSGSTGYGVTWTVTDILNNVSRYYNITQNGTTVALNNWTSGVPFGVSLNGLAAGYYNFSCWVFDGYGGSNMTWAWVTVNDQPSLSQPANITFPVGSTGLSITWIVTDIVNNASRYYTIYQNTTQVASSNWTSGVPFGVSLDGLSANYYNYSCRVFDGYGGSAMTWAWVIVNDVPQLSQPANITFQVGQTGYGVTWTVSDTINNASRYYAIYQNTTQVASSNWTSGVPFGMSLNGVSAGYYNYSCWIFDGYGGSAITWAWVTVHDIPILSQPANVTYNVGQTGYGVTWTVTDIVNNASRYYAIYQNGVFNASNNWTSGIPFGVSLNGLLAGYYNYSCWVFDGYGGSAITWAWVTANDVPQVVIQPSSITYYQGQTGYNLTWTVTDTIFNTTTYQITRNGNPYSNGSWISGVPFSVNVNTTTAGPYNFSCTINDGYSGITVSWAPVTVLAHAVTITTATPTFLYIVGSVGNFIQWNIADAAVSSPTYTIYLNAVLVQTGAWAGTGPYSVNFSIPSTTNTGSYNLSIFAYDGLGLSANNKTTLIVDETPLFGTPDISSVEIGKPITITILVTDNVSINSVVLSFSTDGGTTWANITMEGTAAGTSTWSYSAVIPSQAAGTTVIYQFYLTDNIGVSFMNSNYGQFFSIQLPQGGLEWWVWLAIIGGAAVAVAVIGVVVHRRSSQKVERKVDKNIEVVKTMLATPYVPPAQFDSTRFVPESLALSALPAEQAGKEEEGPGVFTSSSGQIEGPRYIYQVKVQNATEEIIHDVSVRLLNFPQDTMTLETEEMRQVAKIEPNESSSLEFELQPQNDVVEGQFVATVNYNDSNNEFHAVPVQPFIFKTVCEFLEPLDMTELEFDKMIGQWASSKEVFTFEGEEPRALLDDVPAIVGSKNFFVVANRVFGDENSLNAEIKGIAIGKYKQKKLALDVIMESDIKRGEGTITCTGLAEDPSMIITCLGEVLVAFRKRLEHFWSIRFAKFRDVINIQHVFVIHKTSGTAILSEDFGGGKIDANLTSGLQTVLTNFQPEVPESKGNRAGKKAFELDAEGFKILIEDGTSIRAALILKSEASDTIKERLGLFIKRYETAFGEKLKAWRGNLADFATGDKVAADIFEISLLYPYTVNIVVDVDKLGKIERQIYAIGQAITKEQKFFFLPTLMENAMTSLRETRERIFSAIYDMKNNHALEPARLDRGEQ